MVFMLRYTPRAFDQTLCAETKTKCFFPFLWGMNGDHARRPNRGNAGGFCSSSGMCDGVEDAAAAAGNDEG